MRTECRQAAGPGPIEIGILSAMALMLLVFEVIPSTSIGRLATRTSETEMVGYDPGDAYVIPPPPPPEDPVDVENIIENIPEVIVETNQIISTTTDSTLNTVNTVGNIETHVIDPVDTGIPEPGTYIWRDVEPMCTYRPMPEYPEMARIAELEGRVTLMLFVSTEGIPLDVVLAESSGVGSMDDAAVEVAWDSRWNPAQRADGVPVGVWTTLIYEFTLE
jgi:TonB family protein